MEQLDRACRYLERIRSFYQGVSSRYQSANGFDDDIISFFMHCYHIRDCIVHQNEKGLQASDVDEFINQHAELMICADFCNGSKHYKLIQGTRSNPQPRSDLARRKCDNWRYAEPKNNDINTTRLIVFKNDKSLDSLDLAEKCYKLWLGFIKSNYLL